MSTYTHGSYSYWIVWLLFLPLLLVHFFTVYTTRIHSLGALQHCSTWISLEFLWNSTYTGTWLPGLSTYQWIFIIWIHGNITHYIPLVRCLSLYIVIALACCALWTCDCWNPMGYTNCIHTFSPSLSKYGVYNISLLIVLAHAVNCVLCTSIFISLCGFVPRLGVWTHY